jgi:DNA polymerase III alpha subunit
MRYINFHRHSMYSNLRSLDCVVKPEEYMKRAVELGQKEYVTTEHGFQGNIFEAYTLCQQYGLKCIYGVEAYYADDATNKTERSSFHIILIALTEKARREINKIMSWANTDGFYYKPRIDLKCLLSLTPTDTLVTTACIAGRMFKEGWKEKFFEPVYKYFGKNFYLETQAHIHPRQIEYNKKIIQLHRESGIPIIHANDSHYIKLEDAKYRDLFLKAKGIEYADEEGFVLDYPDSDTILQRYKEQGVLTEQEAVEALENTLVIDKAEGVYLDKEFKIPKVIEGDSNKELKRLINEGWRKERENIPREKWNEYIEQIKYEYKIVEDCGMADYFILDHYVVQKAVKDYGAILTRTGRGSAVSFYINKLLGLTEVDRIAAPITLYPTRFMSAERILNSRSLPDIDLNFSDVKPVIQASKDILGEDGIYYMIAYKPLQESSAFRLWCKAQGLDIKEYDDAAKELENHVEDPKWKDLIEESKIFRGVIESVAPSPCSFLLSNDKISEAVGLIKVGEEMCCCLDGYNCDYYKWLKNDYLTVSVYGIIDQVYKMIGRPIDDISTLIKNCGPEVWDIYAKGLTTTINQADSDYDKQILKKYKPQNLAEMSAYVAAIRPGFASLLNNFVERKPYTTGVKELDELLKDSFHYLMYQESIMKYLVWLGVEEKGSYDVIKKIAKKKFKEEELNALKVDLLKSWVAKIGSEKGFAETWQVIQDAVHYSFNACVSGDTIIQKAGIKKGVLNPTVEEMYLIKNDIDYAKRTGLLSLHNKYVSNGYGNALSMYDDRRIRKNKIIDIRFNDVKEIYRVKTKSGAYLDCTMNHKFPTPDGKKKLEDLKVGDLLFVKDKYEKHPDNYRFTNGLFDRNLPTIGQKGFQKKPDGNSVKFNTILHKKQREKCACESCNKAYDGSKFELHYINGDRTNNDEINLKWLCNSCHKLAHYKMGRSKTYSKGIPTFLDEIISIEYLRTDKTYDIEMEDPAHTYLSESGLVTSNSHSLSVALDSMYGAYLKSHYPLEYFTVTLTMYSGDMDRTANLIAELPFFNIKLKDISFGHSKSDYNMDKSTNTIYKGMESIKYMNAQVSNELYELSQTKHYNNFVELLEDFTGDSRQLDILIRLDYFKEFGPAKTLLKTVEYYNKYQCTGATKQFKKDNLPIEAIPFIEKYAKKETEKMYQLDKEGVESLLKEVVATIPQEDLTLKEKISAESEYLGYISITIPDATGNAYVTDIESRGTNFRVTLYDLTTGKSHSVKLKKKNYQVTPIDKGAIISYRLGEEYPWYKDEEGKWKQDETKDPQPILVWYGINHKWDK